MDYIQSAEEIGLFCRLNSNIKKDIPIRSSEMGVLIYIYKNGEMTTPQMISQFFKIKKPSVTSQLNVLIKNEFLIKIPSQVDGRSYSLKVTDSGRNLVETTFGEYLKFVKLLHDEMGEDNYHQFINLIHQANQILGNIL